MRRTMVKKSFRIGLVICDVEDDFANRLCRGAIEAVNETGDSLFIFPTAHLKWDPEISDRSGRTAFEYQRNILLNYAKRDSLDMVLLTLGSIGYFSSKEENIRTLKKFNREHLMLLTSTEPGYPSAMFDNASGLREGLRYMIEQRGLRRFGMLTWRHSNMDAVQREKVFLETLEKYHLPYSPSSVVEQKTQESGKEAAKILIKQNPGIEAVFCFNDEAAKGAYEAFKEMGIAIGKDIAVLGFDDIADAAEMEPPLATVRADAVLLAKKALLKCHAILSGESAPESFTVDTQFVLRESASGTAAVPETSLFYINKLRSVLSHKNAAHIMDHKMNTVSRDMLMFRNSSEKNYSKLLSALEIREIGDCFLYLYEQPILHREEDPFAPPLYLYLKTCKISDQILEVPAGRQKMKIDEIYANPYFREAGKTFIFIDLYSREQQYGIFVCEMPYDYFHYVEQLSYQISIAVKIIDLFNQSESLLAEKEAILKKIERENLILGDISNKDELTGILNRRGFVIETEKMLEAPQSQGRKAGIFYADLNYLKKINDCFGHAEGDSAIRTCARILTDTFDEDTVAGRIGGDEFAVFLLLPEGKSGKSYIADVKRRFRNMKENRFSKAYNLTLSMGVCEFTVTRESRLKDLMEIADGLLYQDKLGKPPFFGLENGTRSTIAP